MTARILVYAEGLSTDGHGSGVLLRRFLGNWPGAVLEAYGGEAPGVRVFEATTRYHPTWRTIPGRILSSLNRLRRGNDPTEPWRNSAALNAFKPDLIYGTAYTYHGLRGLAGLRAQVGAATPMIQHFYDLETDPPWSLSPAERAALLAPPCAFWILSNPMRQAVHERLGVEPLLVNLLAAEAWDASAPPRRRLDGRAVIVGNVWPPGTIRAMAALWAKVRSARPDYGHMVWFCSDSVAKRAREIEPAIDAQVEWAGFLPRKELLPTLSTATLALLPLDPDDRAQTDYARFSMPSRLGDYAAAERPVVLLGSRDSAAARYVTELGMGTVIPLGDPNAALQEIVSLLDNRGALAVMAEKARAARRTALNPESVIGGARLAMQRFLDRHAAPSMSTRHETSK